MVTKTLSAEPCLLRILKVWQTWIVFEGLEIERLVSLKIRGSFETQNGYAADRWLKKDNEIEE